MTFEEYQDWQPRFAAYSLNDFETGKAKQQAILEMATEAAEVLDLLTKANRKGAPVQRERVVDELSDTLWGVVGVMNTFGISLNELIEHNVEKLTLRNAK